jgi:sugar lactone lactonase YvrE
VGLIFVLLVGALESDWFVTTTSSGPSMITVAGTGRRAFSPDGGPAASAALVRPVAVAVGPHGVIYIAEGNRVRDVDTVGRISTVAGTGDPGDAGDGGPATRAELNMPQGLAVDSAGRLYIADTLNNRVRRVDPDGTIRTVAGTGQAGYTGDGMPAIVARLNLPTGLAIGFGDALFISDTANNVVRQLGADGIIRTVAGTGEAGYRGDGDPALYAELHDPGGLAFDDEGNLYVADALNQRIRRVDVKGEIVTVAGTGIAAFSGDNGQGIFAELDLATNPLEGMGQGLAVGPTGDLFIADGLNHRLRRLDVSGVISTVTRMTTPLGVAVDPHGSIYVADADENRVRRIG